MTDQFVIPGAPEGYFIRPPQIADEFPKLRYLDTSKGDNGRVFSIEGGTETWFLGYKYPFPGYFWPEITLLCKIAKRVPVALLRLLMANPVRYFTFLIGAILLILPKSILNKILWRGMEFMADIFVKCFRKYWDSFDFKKFCRSGRELYRVGMLANKKFGGGITGERMVIGSCIIWEFEDMYRFMGQDTFGEDRLRMDS